MCGWDVLFVPGLSGCSLTYALAPARRGDTGIPVEDVRTMEAALDGAGIENEVVIYEGAEHAFLNDTRPSYHAEAAGDAWQRTVAWFRDHLEV